VKNIRTYANDLLQFFHQRNKLKNTPRVNFVNDQENGNNPLGKTGFYDPSQQSITIFISGRHVKDCLRSLAHELVHHLQNERGDFENCGATEEGYAQNDPHLREMEREAYEQGNLCFRDWEDNLKTTNKQLYETIYKTDHNQGDEIMSTKNWKDKELNTLLMEKWGYGKKASPLKEELDAYYDTSKGGDYKTGQKEYPIDEEKDTLEEDENWVTFEDHPQSTAAKQKALDAKEELEESVADTVNRQLAGGQWKAKDGKCYEMGAYGHPDEIECPEWTKELEEQKLKDVIREIIKELA